MSWYTAFNSESAEITVVVGAFHSTKNSGLNSRNTTAKNLEKNTQLFANLWRDFLFHLIKKFNNFRGFFWGGGVGGEFRYQLPRFLEF